MVEASDDLLCRVTGNDRGSVYAAGIHYQFIWIDPPSNTVIVKFSSGPDPIAETWSRSHAEAFLPSARL